MRLVIVANRLPVSISIQDGKPIVEASGGGLTSGMRSFLERNNLLDGQPLSAFGSDGRVQR